MFKWHKYFCLLPRTVNGKFVWLKYVLRKCTGCYAGGMDFYCEFKYKPYKT